MSAFSSFFLDFSLLDFYKLILNSFSSYTVPIKFLLDDDHCMSLKGNGLSLTVLVGNKPMKDKIQAASRPLNDIIKLLIDYCL